MILVKKGPGYLKKVEYIGVKPKDGKDDARKFSVLVDLDEDSDILSLSLRMYSKSATTDYGTSRASEEPYLHLSELPEFALHCSIFDGANSDDLDEKVWDAMSALIAEVSTLKIILTDNKVEFNLEVQAKDRISIFHLMK